MNLLTYSIGAQTLQSSIIIILASLHSSTKTLTLGGQKNFCFCDVIMKVLVSLQLSSLQFLCRDALIWFNPLDFWLKETRHFLWEVTHSNQSCTFQNVMQWLRENEKHKNWPFHFKQSLWPIESWLLGLKCRWSLMSLSPVCVCVRACVLVCQTTVQTTPKHNKYIRNKHFLLCHYFRANCQCGPPMVLYFVEVVGLACFYDPKSYTRQV